VVRCRQKMPSGWELPARGACFHRDAPPGVILSSLNGTCTISER
jgi:hypothetical protein